MVSGHSTTEYNHDAMTHTLNPYWIAGFVDGEGCFHVGLATNARSAFGTQILPEFVVVQHRRDIDVLYALKTYFGCGVVRVNRGDVYAYRVRALQHLHAHIVPFFERYPLHTQKRLDFVHFARVVRAMKAQAHRERASFERVCAMITRHRLGTRQGRHDASSRLVAPSQETKGACGVGR